MTKTEIYEWVADADFVDIENSKYDKCFNLIENRIYKKGEQYFKVQFLNGLPDIEDGPTDNTIDYKVFPVDRKERTIVEYYYE